MLVLFKYSSISMVPVHRKFDMLHYRAIYPAWVSEDAFKRLSFYLMDDFGNAIQYTYELACSRSYSLTNRI